jgi:hypothetical protein
VVFPTARAVANVPFRTRTPSIARGVIARSLDLLPVTRKRPACETETATKPSFSFVLRVRKVWVFVILASVVLPGGDLTPFAMTNKGSVNRVTSYRFTGNHFRFHDNTIRKPVADARKKIALFLLRSQPYHVFDYYQSNKKNPV